MNGPARVLLCLAIASLFGCGDESSAPPVQVNRPPVFSSATSTNVPENTAGTIYTAAATDPDGNALTYSISSGSDAARFAITPAGSLSFVVTPDFENPTDTDGNNIYLLQLRVSDGTASATLDISVTVTDRVDGAFRVRRVTAGFVQPLYLTAVPDGSGRVFVVEQGGRIRILNPATGTIAATPFLDVSTTIASGGEQGLLGFVPATDFATTGRFYIYVTNPAGNIEVRRYSTVAGNRDAGDPASGNVILTIPHPSFTNHNGGWIDFGGDGFLYIAVGDGGGGGDPSDNAQNRNVLLGKLLRIDVRTDAFPNDATRDYAIPAANPFSGGGGAPEIYAYGLRNPFRNAFDRTTGNLYLGDVGQGAVEEIDLIPAGQGGLNFGWARLEGTQTYNGVAPAGVTPPVAQYAHGSGPLQGNSITGGYVYRGPVESLQGQYIFGDFVGAKLWSIPVANLVQGSTLASSAFTIRTADFVPTAGAIGNISSFGEDAARNLYIVDYDGEIFVIEPA
jgi:glucose/arabinose dehydrogenase